MNKNQTSSPKGKIHLSKQLVLNKYMFQLFGAKDFESLTNEMKDSALEEIDVDNVSRFYKHITSRLLKKDNFSADMLQRYDENIVRFTLEISKNRHQKIQLKYFQYLSLLFTEVYLDMYFNRRDKLLKDLNELVIQVNKEIPKKDKLPEYKEGDLKKLAFWNATGSGKTLLMHINIKQYLNYFYRKHRRDELEHIILLTPSEDLSLQHKVEFELSGMDANLFNKEAGGIFKSHEIEILDIHKLRDEMGEKTVAIDSFEGNNLVLVDEGHRGSSGDEWMLKREKLSENGFAFEYSATFGQAVIKKKKLIEEYSKCIIFDYSYRYFHADGYGKEYKILNLEDDYDDRIRHLYLTACLVSYYQQIKVYLNNQFSYKKFFVEKPLWIFVGGSVNAVRTQKGREVSDVTDVLLFVERFIKNEGESIKNLKALLQGMSGLLDYEGREIFRNAFSYLSSLNMKPEEFYKDILATVFNSTISNTTLRVEKLRGQENELALRLGESEPFGVINVGDAAKLWSLCDSYPELYTTERDFSESYFHQINNKKSNINILIGSKKFTEGWSSWRVSTMGLMNIGRSEGSQIIQLFGRGVRLKGYEFSLKRSSTLADKIPSNINYENLSYIETLNVFGIRADYMNQFKEYLEDEGIKTSFNFEEVVLPVVNTYDRKNLTLKSLRLKKGVDFKKQGPKPRLKILKNVPTSKKIVINWYPKIEFKQSNKTSQKFKENEYLNETTFETHNIAFLNIDKLYSELQQYKRDKEWFNLQLSKITISELLNDNSWYILQIPQSELEFTRFEQVKVWEEIALVLLKKYCEQQYLSTKKKWESPHLEYYELKNNDTNFIDDYQFLIETEEQAGILTELKKLKSEMEKSVFSNFEFGQIKLRGFDKHLYDPIVSMNGKSSTIKIKPVALNESEFKLLQDIEEYYEANESLFKDKELYILRNQSRGRGVGFFEEGGFYPDFIMWVLYNGKQYISFIDPKGIRNLSITDPKIEFFNSIKDIEQEMNDSSVILNSFIISNTLHADLIDTGYKLPKEEMEKRNIFFQIDDPKTYIKKMIEKILNS